jgi:hypothetical protein
MNMVNRPRKSVITNNSHVLKLPRGNNKTITAEDLIELHAKLHYVQPKHFNNFNEWFKLAGDGSRKQIDEKMFKKHIVSDQTIQNMFMACKKMKLNRVGETNE